MAATSLSPRIALATTFLLALTGCNSTFGKYSTEDPRNVGRTVDQLRQEMVSSLTVTPAEPVRISAQYCGEDWEEERTISPLPNDPWKVSYNQYSFRADFITSVNSGRDAPPIYRSLLQNLREIDGWEVHEQRAMNGFLNGIGGEKESISIHAFHSPNEVGNISVHIYLTTECYRHPNA